MIEINNIIYRLVINSKSLILDSGQLGKQFLGEANRKRLNNTKRVASFSTTSINRYKKSRPVGNYGLAKELSENFEKQKIDFINKLREIDKDKLEKDTREQAKSPLWFSERRKRITASKVGKVCKMRPYTSCKKTVHELLYGELNYKIKSVEYGRMMETVAKKKFEEIFKLAIKPVGLCVDKNDPYIAGSPDGLIEDDSIIEIKCPFSAITEVNMLEAVKSGKVSFCQIDDKKCVTLKTNHDYYYQIQTQLHVTNRTKCYFFIFTDNWSYNIVILYDVNFWNTKIKLQLDLFYNECLLPELISPLFGKRLLVSDIRDPVRILREQYTRKK
ncbi:uncharacterized protein LOC111035404 isoform X1 [Myzus persicae]|uniref:uncharacterized protein LOC111035404 isoform X1 n=1 Tax=Myzus persicae TaxID=13164 RepID=UPI000B938D4C|nr:uncharacterized protein LOC111035404 isoform X1 [Myzus persicae]XP_022172700.1 uncharacterized protein LOC111035404 isoform X1 [Myzus persicae]XP_022172702.1 uncharacterized protein LOC111035404 isoform X2 [Myzus persicae]XP_022172703.1 uncharacterized protein LOC111035404 isoform X1 [Myzus persicae]